MQMIKEDNTAIYFVIAVIFHSLFIVSINPFSVIKDVSVIGESGMNVQMILIQKGDENFFQLPKPKVNLVCIFCFIDILFGLSS